jgi:outer membrane protein TolC
LPTLQTNSSLSNFLQFAILNQPQVEAAYYDWAASVQRITVERSLPDPRLTFESDIGHGDVIDAGLMMDFPGPATWAAGATGESGRDISFENAMLRPRSREKATNFFI